MYVNIFRGTATRSVGELVREQKERRVHSKLNREKKSGHVKKNHQGLYTFLLDSQQISPLIFFFFFSTTTFIFSRSLYIISLPYWWIARAKYTPSPYVHASRARLNTCTSSNVRVHIAPPAFLPSFLCRLPC